MEQNNSYTSAVRYSFGAAVFLFITHEYQCGCAVSSLNSETGSYHPVEEGIIVKFEKVAIILFNLK